jgi:hypothetical protein
LLAIWISSFENCLIPLPIDELDYLFFWCLTWGLKRGLFSSQFWWLGKIA